MDNDDNESLPAWLRPLLGDSVQYLPAQSAATNNNHQEEGLTDIAPDLIDALLGELGDVDDNLDTTMSLRDAVLHLLRIGVSSSDEYVSEEEPEPENITDDANYE